MVAFPPHPAAPFFFLSARKRSDDGGEEGKKNPYGCFEDAADAFSMGSREGGEGSKTQGRLPAAEPIGTRCERLPRHLLWSQSEEKKKTTLVFLP